MILHLPIETPQKKIESHLQRHHLDEPTEATI